MTKERGCVALVCLSARTAEVQAATPRGMSGHRAGWAPWAAALGACVLLGCGGTSSADEGRTGETENAVPNVGSAQVSDAGRADDSRKPTPSAAGDAGASGPSFSPPDAGCEKGPNLAGDWEGTAVGKLEGDIASDVAGSAQLNFRSTADATNFEVTGHMTVSFSIFPGLPLTQVMTGSVRCGQLAATSDAEIIGIKIHYEVSCQFDDKACQSGLWKAQSVDGRFRSSGTFSAKRKGT